MTPRTLVFASNNPHKLTELAAILGPDFRVLGLKDIGCLDDIPETGETLEENARQKAAYVKERYGYDCIADDTGLLVDALGGAPGVHTARFAGPDHDSRANMELLLRKLQGVEDRRARFRTVIAFLEGSDTHYFTGEVEGAIAEAPSGEGGFGYDPVFIPEGEGVTFAEMSSESKNRISHRGRATQALLKHINRC